ncbi:hypothetical protein SAY86_020648 [Trapa natans]|uniref:SH3 domain-containing protein n=1 Tax=Trapa natans TaxID=22666 RepID=A0AAN7LQU3_TRANT|nr:hypothetical protein SAY86_020648 [Trapa natans]
MEAIRKQATKLREQVAKQQQAVQKHLGNLSGEAFMVDEDDLQCHCQLQNLYESTRAAKVSEPLRTLINGAPLEDARYLTQQYDKLQQEVEAQEVDAMRRQSKSRVPTPFGGSVMRLKAAEGRLTELKSAMMALGKEAMDALLSVEDQQLKITFHQLIRMVDAERSYHQSIVVILEKLHAEMMLEKEPSVPSSPTFLTTQTDADARSTPPGDPKLSDSSYHEENELQDTIFIARVIHPFDAQADGELSLTVGDYIIVWQVRLVDSLLPSLLLHCFLPFPLGFIPNRWPPPDGPRASAMGRPAGSLSAYVERRQTAPSSTVAENSSRPVPRDNL